MSFLSQDVVLVAYVDDHVATLHALFLKKLRTVLLRLIDVPLQTVRRRLGLLEGVCKGDGRALLRHAGLKSLMLLPLRCHAESAVFLLRARLARLHLIIVGKLLLLVIDQSAIAATDSIDEIFVSVRHLVTRSGLLSEDLISLRGVPTHLLLIAVLLRSRALLWRFFLPITPPAWINKWIERSCSLACKAHLGGY